MERVKEAAQEVSGERGSRCVHGQEAETIDEGRCVLGPCDDHKRTDIDFKQEQFALRRECVCKRVDDPLEIDSTQLLLDDEQHWCCHVDGDRSR